MDRLDRQLTRNENLKVSINEIHPIGIGARIILRLEQNQNFVEQIHANRAIK